MAKSFSVFARSVEGLKSNWMDHVLFGFRLPRKKQWSAIQTLAANPIIDRVEIPMTYRQKCKIVRGAGMAVVDGLALTFACADYPNWMRDINGWSVEDAAIVITQQERKTDEISST